MHRDVAHESNTENTQWSPARGASQLYDTYKNMIYKDKIPLLAIRKERQNPAPAHFHP
jgi:hypothetical protein